MGGGTSLWASPEWKKDPKSIYNGRLAYLAVTIAFAGCAYGFDQGNIGGTLVLPTFKHAFGLDKLSEDAADERAGNIAALMAAGGSAGALISAPFADFLGRKYSMIVYGCIYLLGCAFQEVPNLPLFYAGRFLAGVAIGSMSAGAPQFLAENSPKAIRGSMTCLYNLMIITALSLAFWINYGVSKWKNVKVTDYTQWQLSLGIQLIPGFFMVCMLWWVLETPRALIARGKRDDGLKNLMRLRKLPEDHPYLQQEYMEVCAQVDQEQEVAAGRNYMLVIKDIAFVPSNRRRFFLAVMLFLFHKFTGTDSLNYFAPEIFTMIGVKGGSQALLTTGVYGLVKLATTVVYVAFIVDRVGRRLPLMIGASMQATAMLYIALYVRFANPVQGGGTEAGGIIGIVFIYVYAFGWSFGHSVACYVVAAEIFPSRIRSVCMGFCFFVNWIVDFGITKATPSMMTHLGWGTFLLYAVLTYIGVVFIFFCMPEMKGRSIESMDDLFSHSIWTMYKRAYPKEEDKVRHDVGEILQDSKGFGTWQAAPGDAGRAVQTAIKAGYRHLDCAPLYWNEPEIGEALTSVLKSTQTPRSDIFITTKLWSSSHHDPEAALRKSLKDLQLDYVDLYLMHWPVSLPSNALDAPNFGKEDRKAHAQDWDFSKTWALMEKLLSTGLVKAIGVANFSTVNLEKLLTKAKVVPAVNQTELHPLLPQDKLNIFCKKHGIHQTAFGPLGGKGSTLHSHPAVVAIAEAKGVTTGQVLLSWGVTRGWSVIPKSVTEERIRKNLEIFELGGEEVGILNALAMKEGRRFNRPVWGSVIFHDDDESVA
ncbi:uncharacterized protein N0V89_002900 [Didymosphaeria variabile]|uniref:Major facilitator superfamily (MFS) profile domain-containing protein n=1 Tax=Didymosphaeria variabile TaxID=1932322 RepID=A0A9W8XUC3_9PLEO|nr:uncharacterized protein N0V89_002900 [Didymosphaeria variabile]KAJ4358318.1 hypothetical protein N0V89_002900 [Didymosphaeria variabile]